MEFLELNNFKLIGLIGSGECGKVYLVQDQEGRNFAAKVFEGMSIHRALLMKAYERLSQGQWPKGVLRLEMIDLENRPSYWITPFLGEVWSGNEGGKWRLWNLQHRLGSFTEDQAWEVIKEIANALAGMHRKRVTHGNLKPGNVFFDEAGGVQLVDWALGNMPGVSRFEYTDALLYQPPEQLLENNGYYDEAGYGWDVYSFGALAYRLLTGKFPRCNDDFSEVAPKVGEDCMPGLQADLPMIAQSLKEQPEIHWPVEASHKLGKGYCLWIEQCLKLDPADRPGSMIEVAKGFSEVEALYADEEVRESLMDQKRHAKRSERKAYVVAAATVAFAVIMVGLWLLATISLKSERNDRANEKDQIRIGLNAAIEEKKRAENEMKLALEAKQKADDEVEKVAAEGMARLKAMFEIDDRLFEWGMEKGRRTLPALDGREVRLAKLEQFYEEFQQKYAGNPELAEELARAKLHYAEIALAAGNEAKAEERLDAALKAWEGRELDAVMKLRLGRNALFLAIIKQRADREGLELDFQRARKALSEVPEVGIDVDQLKQWQAILDFHESKLLAERGDETKALEQLMRATRTLNQLADARPDAAVLRSELASCYLSSATILEGLGKFGEASEVRISAASDLEKMLKTDPTNVDLMLDLAGCYGAIAESALLSGEVEVTGNYSTSALTLLNKVLKLQPESKKANTRKAAQLGIQAGLLRDQGKPTDAMKAFEEGIAILERQSKYPMRDYRLALLNWQKGKMLGFSGKKDEELKLLNQANEALKSIQVTSDDDSPRLEVLRRSRAYLLGDMAHALEMSEQTEKAEVIYRETIGVWEELLKLRPNSEEYRSALEWSKQRVNQL